MRIFHSWRDECSGQWSSTGQGRGHRRSENKRALGSSQEEERRGTRGGMREDSDRMHMLYKPVYIRVGLRPFE